MVTLTKLDGSNITINADEIETIESSHDTTVGLISGKKIIVKESSDEIVDRIIEFKKKCYSELLLKLPS